MTDDDLFDIDNALRYGLNSGTLADKVEAFVETVRAALTDEDEIAHGEAVTSSLVVASNTTSTSYVGIGRCAYCDEQWPCRTQRGIDRLLAHLPATMAANDK